MGLFSKKTCDFCGGEIGLLSNKKLANGNMCKECNKELSLWFDSHRESTIDDIKNQLAAREENRKLLETFETTNAYGITSCIMIDQKNKKFVAIPNTSESFFGSNKVYTNIEEIKDKNPDIVDFSQVESVKVEAKVNANEIKQTVDGKQVSYDPKHYTYMCNFFVEIKLNHPYIKEMRLQINGNPIAIKCNEPRRVTTYADEIRAAFTGYKKADYNIENNPDYKGDVNSLKDFIYNKIKTIPDYSFGFKVDKLRNWKDIQKYHHNVMICEEIKNIIEGK